MLALSDNDTTVWSYQSRKLVEDFIKRSGTIQSWDLHESKKKSREDLFSLKNYIKWTYI